MGSKWTPRDILSNSTKSMNKRAKFNLVVSLLEVRRSLLRNKNTPIPAVLWIRVKFRRGANARGINPFSACHRVRPCWPRYVLIRQIFVPRPFVTIKLLVRTRHPFAVPKNPRLTRSRTPRTGIYHFLQRELSVLGRRRIFPEPCTGFRGRERGIMIIARHRRAIIHFSATSLVSFLRITRRKFLSVRFGNTFKNNDDGVDSHWERFSSNIKI